MHRQVAEANSEPCYRAMDFLLESLPELQETVFFAVAVADLLQLHVDLFFLKRSRTTQRQCQILDQLGLPEPPRYFEFTPPATDTPSSGPSRV